MRGLKGVVAYDTYYGNTKQVAEALAEQIRAEGHEVELRNVRDRSTPPPIGDFMFVGSPVRFKKVTRATKRFVKRLDLAAWKGKPVAIFTTVGEMPGPDVPEKKRRSAERWILPGALEFRDLVRARGLNAVEEVLRVGVKDLKGPLVPGGIEQTRAFAADFLHKHLR